MRFGHASLIFVLSTIVAISIAMQLSHFQLPCAFCILQRSLMLMTAIASAFCLRFGIQVQYLALSLLSSALGIAISLTQIALHACPQFPIFGNPVFGLSLYTWSFLIFSASALSIVLSLFNYKEEKRTWNFIEKVICIYLFIVISALALITLQQCGWGDCSGAADAAMYTKPRE